MKRSKNGLAGMQSTVPAWVGRRTLGHRPKRAKITLGPRGLLSNYPPDVVAVTNGHPITKGDLLVAKQKRQAKQLAWKRSPPETIIKPAYVWAFHNPRTFYTGWHLYVRTLHTKTWLHRNRFHDARVMLKAMRLWPCGCLPALWNLRLWFPRFAAQYPKVPGQFEQQGHVQCWAQFRGANLVDIWASRPESEEVDE